MALRKRSEDTVIGVFIILSLLYPFLISLLIWYQDKEKIEDSVEAFKQSGYFLLGKLPCTEENALKIRSILSDILKEIFTRERLIELCIKSKEDFKGIREIQITYKVDKDNIAVKFIANNREVLVIEGKTDDKKPLIGEIYYEKRD